MTNDQQTPKCIHTQSQEELFTVIPIFNRNSKRVPQDALDIRKIDAMLTDVAPVFGRVELDSQSRVYI